MANEQTVGQALRELADIDPDTLTELAASIGQTELDYLDGVTAGTVTASKALVVDANKDIATIRHATISGNIVHGSTTLSETDTAKIDGITNGTQAAGKAVVADANVNTGVSKVTQLHIGTSGSETQVTSTAAELNLLDGSAVANSTASVAPILDASKQLRTNANVGTANTGTTAVEYGDGFNHTSVLTVSTTLPAIAGGANLAVGKLLYTFPAGEVIVNSTYMTLAITQSEGNITADTPDGGIGTTIGSGVVATLDGTPAFENIITGQTFNDCNGTAEVITLIPTAAVPLVIAAGGDHTVYFNVADGWAASGDSAAGLAGTVVLNWTFLA